MKKRESYGICAWLLLSSLLLGCAGPSLPLKTQAVRLDAEEQAALGYVKATSYRAENVIAYEQEDGTTRLCLFSAPVEEGPLSLQGEEDDAAFSCKAKFTDIAFPALLHADAPIHISTLGQPIRIFPADQEEHAGRLMERTNAFGQKRQTMQYADLFGKGIHGYCTPTSFGVNIEAVLNERPEENTLQLQVMLPPLFPDTGSPDYILMKNDPTDGEVKSILYTPLAVDHNGRWNYTNGIRLADKNPASGLYTLEYTLDSAFLDDPNTEYPVTLHQSVYNYLSKQPDTSAYSLTGEIQGYYLSPYALLGDATPKGEGWTYLRFEALNTLNIQADDILSAKYIFHNLFDLPEPAVVGAYAVTADWCSINTRWYNRPTYDDKPVGLVSVQKQGDYELDITALLREMIKSKGREGAKYSVQNSFLIRCDTPGSNILLASGDNSLYSPCLELIIK